MTLLDYQTNRSEGLQSAPAIESITTEYFTFLVEPTETDLDELATLEAWAELTRFDTDPMLVPPLVEEPDDESVADSGHADLSTAYARCSDGAGTLTHLFFSEDKFDLARARRSAAKCRLAPTCLSDAIDREEPYGVWGGQLLVNGLVVAVKRGRGRPPKNPLVLLAVDEVPLPPHMVA